MSSARTRARSTHTKGDPESVRMAAFHHDVFMPDDPAIATAADDIWQFCLAAIGGAPEAAGRGPRRRRNAS